MKLIISGWRCVIYLCMLVLLNFVHSKSSEHCSSFETCAKCIGNEYSCVWCPAEPHTGPRCVSKKAYEANNSWCKTNATDPPTEQEIVQFKNFTSSQTSGETVQLRPQHIKFKLRVGEVTHFNMFYKPAKDFPLDLYYLMDNSFTMKPHKNNLADQAEKIYDSLKKLTNNVRFGMGTFVDKLALPFANPFEDVAYSFKNHYSLSTNIAEFGEVVRTVKSVGNLDDLEGGLDALMQVMLCKKDIDWRDEARRMVILFTDNSYHSAGDGKFGGAYKHNPMECRLKNGSYPIEDSVLYDYPSVSQIKKVAQDEDITIIFAAVKKMKHVYDALKKQIQSAKYVELSPKSDIVELITEEYLKLAQDLKISEPSLPPHVKLTLDPPCSTAQPCRVQHGEQKQINIALSVTECSAKNKFTIELGPQGLRDKLVVDVDVHCSCSCEKDKMIKSPKCSNFGDYQCGICNCNEGRYGATCECEGDLTIETAMEKCKVSNDSNVCSGRGKCRYGGVPPGCNRDKVVFVMKDAGSGALLPVITVWRVPLIGFRTFRCGKCESCDTGFVGPQCQYSEHDDCPYVGGWVCAGHGHCVAPNVCRCDLGWAGPYCSCTQDKKSCYAPRSDRECSGNGHCICGQCQCYNGDLKYTGNFCEFCEGCADARCVELTGFAQCLHHSTSTNKTQVEDCKHKFNVTYSYNVEVLTRTEINAPMWKDAHRCKAQDDERFIVFKFIDKDDSTTLLIQREKEEPSKANIWVAVGIAIGTILLVGLLTAIVWKILVDIHDAKEYEKFAKQAEADGFVVAQNPLYQSPAVNFENPTYKRRSIKLK